MKQRNVCNTCWMQMLRDEKAMESWLEDRLLAARTYMWHAQDALGQEAGEFRYPHPDAWRRWLDQGPCVTCPCENWCNRVCALRARWWDDRVGQLRKCLGAK